MDTTARLIERCKAAIGATSDYRLAKVLNVSHTTLLHWRNGKTKPDDKMVIEMSKLIGCNPGRIVATLHAERAKCAQTRLFWLDLAEQLPRTANARI
jgi:DNA-binding XRE family transcriptional regulator